VVAIALRTVKKKECNYFWGHTYHIRSIYFCQYSSDSNSSYCYPSSQQDRSTCRRYCSAVPLLLCVPLRRHDEITHPSTYALSVLNKDRWIDCGPVTIEASRYLSFVPCVLQICCEERPFVRGKKLDLVERYH
jgi:hypothetical protein